jgi:hypothetical protein
MTIAIKSSGKRFTCAKGINIRSAHGTLPVNDETAASDRPTSLHHTTAGRESDASSRLYRPTVVILSIWMELKM